MYLGGTSHLLFRIITLLHCIFTYSASFQAAVGHKKEQQLGLVVMDEINSTHLHVPHNKQQSSGKQIFYSE